LPENQTPSVSPLKSAGDLMPLSLHARGLEDLRDVDQRHALFARGQCRGHPVDDHVGAAAGDDLARVDVRAA
jgi:hypothetical protein